MQPTTIDSERVSHITGFAPPAGANNLLRGDGAFARAQATVRLSGAVDMRRLATNNEITFDCIFVVTFR